MNVLGVIPARGGSKGVPRKNIKRLDGIPLIGYTIKAALSSKFLTKVVVSTEDEEIAAIAKDYGAKVPFIRPHELSTDTALAIPTMQHALEMTEKNDGKIYDALMMLQPTTPFRSAADIDGALTLFGEENADSVISVAKHLGQHPAKMKYLEDGRLMDPPFGETSENTPRQFLKDVYKLNGALYLTRRNILLGGSFKGESCMAWVMPEERSVNIDTQWDWMYAEMLIERRLVPSYKSL